MGIFDFLINGDDHNDTKLIYETGRNLGMSDEEIEMAIDSGIAPEEWLEENDYENYKDQELDQ